MDILYYYTTAETLKYILTQGDIFASHISYLNDSEEYVNGLRELRELFVNQTLEGENINALNEDAYEEALSEIPQIYSISFSKEADLLSQWYMYARESGVRLAFDFSGKEQKFEIKGKYAKKEDPKKQVEAILRDVHYFTRIGMPYQEYQKEKEIIERMIQKYAKEIEVSIEDEANHIRLWKEIAPYIKNYEFRQEKEVRLIFKAVVDGGSFPKSQDEHLIEYRNAKGVLIPYLDVYREDGWPVVEIMVGPGRNQTRVYNSICHFVEHSILKIPKIDQRKSMERFINGLSFYQVEKKVINTYCETVKDRVYDSQEQLTYKSQIDEILSMGGSHEKEYLDRNYYSSCGIIVRKSNAPYEFS